MFFLNLVECRPGISLAQRASVQQQRRRSSQCRCRSRWRHSLHEN